MNKKLLALLIVLVLSMTSMPVAAAGHSVDFHHDRAEVTTQAPVVYEGTITVTDRGGKFQVGFVNLEFRKDFLEDDRLPATFYVKVFVKDGEAGIEIDPSTTGFQKTVLIKVEHYEGLLYDETQGRNVNVDIKRQVIQAEHFSWYRFR